MGQLPIAVPVTTGAVRGLAREDRGVRTGDASSSVASAPALSAPVPAAKPAANPAARPAAKSAAPTVPPTHAPATTAAKMTVAALEEKKGDPSPPEWVAHLALSGWAQSLDLHKVVLAAVGAHPSGGGAGAAAHLERLSTLTRAELDALLTAARLQGLSDVVWAGLLRLQQQRRACDQ